LIEAQSAGLPCLYSTVVPPEADVVAPLLKRLDLSQSAECWAEQLLQHYHQRSLPTSAQALQLIASSPFNIETAVARVETIYAEACQRVLDSCQNQHGESPVLS
jgi:hypothetical protein